MSAHFPVIHVLAFDGIPGLGSKFPQLVISQNSISTALL
jgi:hypothetical protein